MPRAYSSHDAGMALSSTLEREPVNLGPASDFFADLAKMRQVVGAGKRPAMKMPAPLGGGRSSRMTSGPIVSGGDGGGGGGRVPAERVGRHSFVKLMHGPNQVSGWVRTGFQPGAAYGGWDPTDDRGAVQLAMTPPPWQEASTLPDQNEVLKQKNTEGSFGVGHGGSGGRSLAMSQRQSRAKLY